MSLLERVPRRDLGLVAVLWLMTLSMSGIENLSAVVGLAAAAVFVGWAMLPAEDPLLDDPDTSPVLLLTVVAIAVLTLASPPVWFETVQNALVVLPVAVAAVVLRRSASRAVWVGLTVALVAAVAISSMWVLGNTSDKQIDIILAHEAAADALADLENPYEVVRFEATSGFDELPDFEGYPYPAVSLIAYTIGWGAIPVELLAAVYVAGVVALLAATGIPSGRGAISTSVAAVVAATPALGFMLYSAATEGFTSLLFVASGVLWRRRPLASAALLGLALASKQYLLVPAIALLFADVDRRWARIGTGVAAAAVATMPFFAWDPAAYWTAVFDGGNFALQARPDSVGLGGFGITVPTVVVAAIALAVMWTVRHRFTGPASFYWVAAIGLTVALVGSPHSLINHWFGLVALVATGIVTGWDPARRPVPGVAAAARTRS